MKKVSKLTIILISWTLLTLILAYVLLRLSVEQNILCYFFYYLYLISLGCLIVLIRKWLGEMTVKEVVKENV